MSPELTTGNAMEDYNTKLRKRVTKLFEAISAGKYRCKCGGKLKAEVECYEGRSCNENVWLHCSRERCNANTRWYAGFDLPEAFEEWQDIQKRMRARKKHAAQKRRRKGAKVG